MRVGPHDGISALVSRGREESSLSSPCEGTVRRELSLNQGASSHQELSLLVSRSWMSRPPDHDK